MTTIITIALGAIAIVSTIMWAYWRYQYGEMKEEHLQLKLRSGEFKMTITGKHLKSVLDNETSTLYND